MSVIASTAFISRRITDANRRLAALREQRERANRVLPEWTLLPLRMAGMSAAEIEEVMQAQLAAEERAGIEEIDRQIEQVELEIERIETQLLNAPSLGVDGASALLRLALDRLREKTVQDETSVFYDYGEARLLSLVERAALEVADMTGGLERRAS